MNKQLKQYSTNYLLYHNNPTFKGMCLHINIDAVQWSSNLM